MYVVIFRAQIKELDTDYSVTAAKLRELALSQFGCLDFHAVTEGNHEIAISYWPDEDSIKKWKQYSDHLMAQKLGREKWYESYSVTIAEVRRQYKTN